VDEQEQHQVRARGKIRRVVADHERREVRGGFLYAGVDHLDLIAAERVHLGVELEGQDAVAQVDQAGAGVFAHDLLAIPRRLQDEQIARLKPSRYVGSRL
jgi:hypothetical protein